MGIKSINDILKENCPSVFEKVKLKSFEGGRIAIDSNLYFNTIICSSYKSVVNSSENPIDEDIDINLVLSHSINYMLNFICKLLLSKVEPIWVWDGKSKIEKKECIDKRKKSKEQQNLKISSKKEEITAVNPLLRTPDKIKEYKALIGNKNIMNHDLLQHFRNIIELLGFISIQAPADGEKMCSALCHEDIVKAVWSKDTDNYILGTKILITGFNGYDEENNIVVDIVNVENIFLTLNKPKEWFTDLCIMLGCDFNTNIPRVGLKKSWALMNKYSSIESIIENNKQFNSECLNIEMCREIFKYEPSDIDLSILNFSLEKFNTHINDIIEQYNIPHQTFKLLIKATTYN